VLDRRVIGSLHVSWDRAPSATTRFKPKRCQERQGRRRDAEAAKRDQEGSQWPPPLALQTPTAEYEQHDDDDQDHAEDANPTARSIVGISVITSTEAAKHEQQDDDDQD
jgi:hypothetical protein